eukprot:TRINITY_DN13859_c0_g1_i1.p1 TRINITY_DN13859_c0_g1~~TRINITY_DN13859_c0_g1_i1.p1  ORF type:complete len:852 (-),score=226.48 TRINITY_DN13859_c0_g1_i1:160-2715(-)
MDKIIKMAAQKKGIGGLGASMSMGIAAKMKMLANKHKNIHGKGIPIREGLQALFNIKRSKFCSEALVFAVFFCTILVICLLTYDVHEAFSTNDAIVDLFLDEEFEGAQYKKNFYEIMTMEEFWQWMKGPLINGLFQTEWYNTRAFTEDEKKLVIHNLHLVGKIQVRQLRVDKDSCYLRRFLALGNRFDTKDGSCFDEFASDVNDKTPFGPASDPEKYKYSTGYSSLEGLYGYGPDYGEGGFVVELPNDYDGAKAAVDELFDDRWVDKGTRIVSVNFILYNAQTDLATVARINMEFYSSGRLQPSYKLFTMQFNIYSSFDIVAVLEIIYVLFVLYYFQKEIRRLRWTKPFFSYFWNTKNAFEVIFLTVNFITIAMWLMFYLDSKRKNFDQYMEDFVDNYDMAYYYIQTFSFASLCLAVSALKVFQYLSLNKRMGALWFTLKRAGPDLVAFGLCFGLIVMAFALVGQFLFGHIIRDFHSFASAYSSLIRFPLGDFNYSALAVANPAYAGYYFSAYVALVFLVLLNMFIAIITKHFNMVQENIHLTDAWKKGAENIESALVRRVTRLVWKVKGSKDKQTGENREAIMKTWAREQAFKDKMHEASVRAKKYKNVDLFAYFEKAYGEFGEGKNSYINVEELCTLVRGEPRCEHRQCFARKVVHAYDALKEVVMLDGNERSSLPQHDKMKHFALIKVNRLGIRQKRVLYLDAEAAKLINTDLDKNVKRVLNMNELVQIENSNQDKRRTKLVFHPPSTGDDFFYNLIFPTPGERERFNNHVLQIVRDLAPASTDSKVGTDSVVKSANDVSIKMNMVMVQQRQLQNDIRTLASMMNDITNSQIRMSQWIDNQKRSGGIA